MYIQEDSGGCCGIKHLCRVGGAMNTETAQTKLDVLDSIVANRANNGVLITMSLTNQQLALKGTREVFVPGIKERGWQLVTRFLNPNSGNIVNVFHYTSNLRTAKVRNLPFRPCNQGDNNA